MEEQLRDTPLQFERQSVALCPHGKIPVTLVRNGELKAVNRNTAHLLLQEYGVYDLQLLTGLVESNASSTIFDGWLLFPAKTSASTA